jgi:hypothetical protein
MDEVSHQPVATRIVKVPSVDSRHAELGGIVSTLEHSLERIDALGLTLVAALLDHAVSEAKRRLND